MTDVSSSSWTAALVVTTINGGEFLRDYHAALLREGLLERVNVIVIPDRKTPPCLYERCIEYARLGLRVTCPTLEQQEEYLRKINLAGFIPYDSDNRRNIGYLMALEMGCEVLISIDDDNYCLPETNFFQEHAVVCQPVTEGTCVSSSTGWFNICDLMQVQPVRVWPRGTPYKYHHQSAQITRRSESGRVRLNAGLWLGEPDLDAMTWLVSPVRATAFKDESVLLDPTTWTPINSQNTALHRDLIVSYYFVPMNHPLGTGLIIDRYGDIFSGYFCQACVRHLGDRIRVGTPVADHRRNSHNYLRDAACEMGCIWMLDDLADWLTGLRLQGTTYHETYLSLAAALDDVAERSKGQIWTEATRQYVHHMTACMRRWTSVCQRWL